MHHTFSRGNLLHITLIKTDSRVTKKREMNKF